MSLKGFKITTALDGAQGIEILKKRSFPLIITDIMMPKTGGLEVLRYVKEHIPQSLAIMLTGYATLESAIASLRENAYDYIFKPFDCRHLLTTINRAFDLLDIREKKATAEEELRRLTLTDDLTGLFNRRNFHTVLLNEMKRANRYNNPLSMCYRKHRSC